MGEFLQGNLEESANLQNQRIRLWRQRNWGSLPDPPEGLLLPEGTCTPHGQGGLGGDPVQACRVLAHTSRLPLAFPGCHNVSEADAGRD